MKSRSAEFRRLNGRNAEPIGKRAEPIGTCRNHSGIPRRSFAVLPFLTALLLLCLAPRLAFADGDAPRMYQPERPEMVGYPNWVLTNGGKEKLDATLERQFHELIALRTENSSLKGDLVKMESKPALTWKGALLFIGLGVVTGAAATGLIVWAAR